MVNGSQRWPSLVRHQPLKSAVQTRLGRSAPLSGSGGRARCGRGRPRPLASVQPIRRARRATVARLGTLPSGHELLLISRARSFFGPPVVMTFVQLNQGDHGIAAQLQRTGPGPTAKIYQTLQSRRVVSTQPLIAGLPADAELPASCAHVGVGFTRNHYELNSGIFQSTN